MAIKIKSYAKPNTSSSAPKIRAMTDPEKAMSQWKQRYQKNGKTTWGGAMRLTGDVIKTSIKRVLGINGD